MGHDHERCVRRAEARRAAHDQSCRSLPHFVIPPPFIDGNDYETCALCGANFWVDHLNELADAVRVGATFYACECCSRDAELLAYAVWLYSNDDDLELLARFRRPDLEERLRVRRGATRSTPLAGAGDPMRFEPSASPPESLACRVCQVVQNISSPAGLLLGVDFFVCDRCVADRELMAYVIWLDAHRNDPRYVDLWRRTDLDDRLSTLRIEAAP